MYSSGLALFAVARNGTALYWHRRSLDERELVVLGSDGSEEVLPIDPGPLRDPRFAPDGRRIAYRHDTGERVFVFSTETGTNTLVSGDFAADFPLWSADGLSLTMGGEGDGTDDWDGIRAPADGTRPPRVLFTRPYRNFPQGWLSDGRLLVREVHPERGGDLLIYRFESDSLLVGPYLNADWDESTASISPDTGWVAYCSNESGRMEVYVRTLPDPSAKIQISQNGGTEPRWSPDGRTLYYREGSSLMAADLGSGPGIEVRGRNLVFAGEDHYTRPVFSQYDVHPDGTHFLVIRNRASAEEVAQELVIAVNWFREMEERLTLAGGG